MPISGKDMVKLFEKKGYRVIKNAGKGSHVKLRNLEGNMVIIPQHKELKKGTENSLKKKLGGL